MTKDVEDTAVDPRPAAPEVEQPDLEQVHAASDKSKYLEEGEEGYKPGGFHPVYIGDVYHSRYEVLSKIGYGGYSTVWMVRDLEAKSGDSEELRALKVLRADSYGTTNDIFEREILNHLMKGDKNLMGYQFVSRLVDDFEHDGPNGKHVCLVFELYGETLRSFGAWFKESMIPWQVMRRITIQVLLALDYAHDSNVIHTDIQPNNIFVKMRNHHRIASEYLSLPAIYQDKSEEKYTVIPSRPLYRYYFDDGDRFDHFDFVLGDWGVSSWADDHLTDLIQPVALRAPEVLIKAPWGPAADIWNLGAAVLEMFRAVRMFSGVPEPNGSYDIKEHLAEIVHLLGPFPKIFLGKGNPEIVGRVFDDEGKVKDITPFVDRPDLNGEEFTPGLTQEERDEFIAFLRYAMKIDPAERPSPEDLLRGPWLRAIQ